MQTKQWQCWRMESCEGRHCNPENNLKEKKVKHIESVGDLAEIEKARWKMRRSPAEKTKKDQHYSSHYECIADNQMAHSGALSPDHMAYGRSAEPAGPSANKEQNARCRPYWTNCLTEKRSCQRARGKEQALHKAVRP
jgi:hypothetical protein